MVCSLLAVTVVSDMNIKYDVSAAALVNHRATRDLQLQDCVWSLATAHLIHTLPHSAVMALLRTAVCSEIVGIDYWLRFWLDIRSGSQESVNNFKRKFRPHCTVIRAQLALTVQQLPVWQGGWEPTQRQSPPPPPPVLSAQLRRGQARLQSALAS